jgi:DNA-directed RNA polymerase subunit RPC12/RpoP
VINVLCESCGRQLVVPDQFAGTTGKCNHCSSEIVVPESRTRTPVQIKVLGALLTLWFGLGVIGGVLEFFNTAFNPHTLVPLAIATVGLFASMRYLNGAKSGMYGLAAVLAATFLTQIAYMLFILPPEIDVPGFAFALSLAHFAFVSACLVVGVTKWSSFD